MKTHKIFLFGSLLSLFLFTDKTAFAATGGARDGQLFFLFLIGALLLLLGIQYITPILIHWIRDVWKKVHHC